MIRPGSYAHIERIPRDCVRWLNDQATYYAPVTVNLIAVNEVATVLDVELHPPGDLGGYPVELARIIVQHATRQVYAVPLGPDRTWHHRNPRIPPDRIPVRQACAWASLIGSLCLWDPRDPVGLRWRWANGLDAFIAIVQRHLVSEEYYRRHGHWPAEDSPHGDPEHGHRHPIITPAAREAAA